MKLIQPIYVSALALLACASMNAQQKTATFTVKKSALTEAQKQRWSDLDLGKDSIPGMSVDRAYTEFLKGKKGTKIIVGVIDSGLDIDHEDLKGKIWTNKKEIPGNNIDDDGNGFVDDVHGWNFLGEATKENLELTRIVKKGDDGSVGFKEAKAAYDAKLAEFTPQKQQADMFAIADKDIRTYLKKEKYTAEDLKAITTTDADLLKSKQIMSYVASKAGVGFQEDLKDYIDQVYNMMNYNLNVNFDGRKVGDNPDDMKMTHYGNGNVKGPNVEDALHGTHVAGIIAQIRGNGIGGDGVVNDNVEIMSVRAVPDGDEYDKDIALAIRYAVDNGAKVINGSFGKDYSPHKEWVWDALRYAAKKDVLFVHAAGNDSKNIDTEPNFPTDVSNDKEIADNVITVGALNNVYGSKIVAEFSNYGAKNVDVFAPGVEIYATVPNNKYRYEQGTSMASPNVAGVAALVRSYYPKLTASQVKHILMGSGTPITESVIVDETKKSVPFASTCVSGKIVNAYNALVMADKLSKETNKTKKQLKK